MRRTVVLPPPLGPNSATNSPSLTAKETASTAATCPNCLPTFFQFNAHATIGAGFRLGRAVTLTVSSPVQLLFPFEEGLEAQRQQRQQGQKAGDGKAPRWTASVYS